MNLDVYNREKFHRGRSIYWRRCQLWANARRRLGAAFFDNLAAVERAVSAQLEAEFGDQIAN